MAKTKGKSNKGKSVSQDEEVVDKQQSKLKILDGT
jgi:hypothetical protein